MVDARGVEPELQAALESAWSAEKRDDVPLSAEAFVAHVSARLAEGDVLAGLASLQMRDLYLAAACAARVTGALEAFERELGGEVERAVRRHMSRGRAVAADDVGQMLREKLFVGRPDAPPKIGDYSGRGPLRVWLRVVLMRMVQNLSMRGPKDSPMDGAVLAELPAGAADPELEAMRATYKSEFRAAFSAAVASLEVRDRVLLQQRFSLHKTQEELAEEYGVHVNTAARWLARVRKLVEERTRDDLRRRLKVEEGEFTSLLRVVASQLDLTLGKVPEAPGG
jgi:RNA polymerase sigma-70 factor (ECF subfamily)